MNPTQFEKDYPALSLVPKQGYFKVTIVMDTLDESEPVKVASRQRAPIKVSPAPAPSTTPGAPKRTRMILALPPLPLNPKRSKNPKFAKEYVKPEDPVLPTVEAAGQLVEPSVEAVVVPKVKSDAKPVVPKVKSVAKPVVPKVKADVMFAAPRVEIAVVPNEVTVVEPVVPSVVLVVKPDVEQGKTALEINPKAEEYVPKSVYKRRVLRPIERHGSYVGRNYDPNYHARHRAIQENAWQYQQQMARQQNIQPGQNPNHRFEGRVQYGQQQQHPGYGSPNYGSPNGWPHQRYQYQQYHPAPDAQYQYNGELPGSPYWNGPGWAPQNQREQRVFFPDTPPPMQQQPQMQQYYRY